MEDEYQIVCNLSNVAISNDLEWTLILFKVTAFFDAKYLTNGYRYAIVTTEGE